MFVTNRIFYQKSKFWSRNVAQKSKLSTSTNILIDPIRVARDLIFSKIRVARTTI